jgi:hypothetical protein
MCGAPLTGNDGALVALQVPDEVPLNVLRQLRSM